MESKRPDYFFSMRDVYGTVGKNRKLFLVLIYPVGKAIVYKNDIYGNDNIDKIMEIVF